MLGNVGVGELIVILIISILVVGPKRTVEIARTLGRISRQLRDLSREFTNALQAEIDATESETGDIGAELRHVADELRVVFTGAEEEIDAVEREAAEIEADLGRVARDAHGTLAKVGRGGPDHGSRYGAPVPTGAPAGAEDTPAEGEAADGAELEPAEAPFSGDGQEETEEVAGLGPVAEGDHVEEPALAAERGTEVE